MKAISGRFLWGWAAGIALGLALSAASVIREPAATDTPDVAAPPPALVTVIGTVEIGTEDRGRTRSVRIVDAEAARRRVLIIDDENGAGRSIAGHEGERVAATGVVSRRGDGREVLWVSSFEPRGG